MKTNKTVLQKLNSNRYLLLSVLGLIGIFYLTIALISFNPSDPSWLHVATVYDSIHNLGGSVGAWLADILFLIFGILAYLIPVIMLCFCWNLFIHHDTINFFSLLLKLIGSLALLLSSCSLIALNIDDLYYFSAGGVIGTLLSNELLSYFNYVSANIMMLCIWMSGLTLFIGWYWLAIAKKIGSILLSWINFVYNLKWRIGRDLLLQSFVASAIPCQLKRVNTTSFKKNLGAHQGLTSPPIKKLYTNSFTNNMPTINGWQSNPSIFYTPCNFTTAQPNNVTLKTNSTVAVDKSNNLPAFMSVFSTSCNNYSPLIKQNIELNSRLKTVHKPMKKKLASYGIRIPTFHQCQATSILRDKQCYKDDNGDQDNKLSGYKDKSSVNYNYSASQSRTLIEEKSNNHFKQPMSSKTSVIDSMIHPFLMRKNQISQNSSTSLPSIDLLTSLPKRKNPVDMLALEQIARLIEARLADYNIKVEVKSILPGPVITCFELNLAPGVKAARISNLSRDLARSLSVVAVRVVEVIPGKPYVGIELPNEHRLTVYLREVLDCYNFQTTSSPLTLVLGKDISGQVVIVDLGKMPHLLVAGTTGSGKSVGINAMIISILYKATPNEVRFIMIDPKMLELSVYEGIPHLLTKVITDMKDSSNALQWCVGEMERRYKLMSSLGVRNLAGYNERVEQAEKIGKPVTDPFYCKSKVNVSNSLPVMKKLPYIVVIVDELADLMMVMGKKVEELIARLAQKARAAGIHLILATQRPSVDVITGLIKSNIPTRISFTVSSKIDSRTILDQSGAESLLGMGDMLYLAPNSSLPMRIHGVFVHDEEICAVVNNWKKRGQPQYINSIFDTNDENITSISELYSVEELDPLFDQIMTFIIDKRRVSISSVQRQFRIGYNRAARIIKQMELQGIISSPSNNSNRKVLSPSSHE